MKKGQFAILIAVIVICAGGIFSYVKYRLDNEKQFENKTNDKTEEVDKVDLSKGVSRYDLGKALYEKYQNYYFLSGNHSYEKDHKNESEKDSLFSATYTLIDKSLFIIYNRGDFDTCVDQEFSNDEEREKCLTLEFKKSDFETAYKSLFGPDKEVDYDDFRFYISTDNNRTNRCKLVNNLIKCYFMDLSMWDGDPWDTDFRFYHFKNAVELNDTLYVDVEYLETFAKYDGYEDINKNVIISFDVREKYNQLTQSQNTIAKDVSVNDYKSYPELNDNDLNKLFNTYGSYANLYRMTFKKASDGNYYWNSTETIK